MSEEDVSAVGMLETSDAQLMSLDVEIEKQVHPEFESKETSNQVIAITIFFRFSVFLKEKLLFTIVDTFV